MTLTRVVLDFVYPALSLVAQSYHAGIGLEAKDHLMPHFKLIQQTVNRGG